MELSDLTVQSDSPAHVVRAITDLYPSIATVLERRRVNRALLSYLSRFGEEGLWSRVNGKSLAQIVEEYDNSGLSEVVEAEGEAGGLKYRLIRHEEQGESSMP